MTKKWPLFKPRHTGTVVSGILEDMKVPALSLLFLILFSFCRPGPVMAAPLVDEVREQLRFLLEDAAPAVELPGIRQLLVNPRLRQFYRQRNHVPAWMNNLGLTTMAHQLLDVLRASGDKGLCSDHYHLQELEPLVRYEADSLRAGVLFDARYQALIDLLLTDAYFGYAVDISGGRIPPVAGQRRKGLDRLIPYLEKALGSGQITAGLERLEPRQPGYLALRDELQRLRALSAYGGWPTVPAGEVLRPGMRDERLPVLRNRLFFGGDLQPYAAWDEKNYGPETEQAVRRFQLRHGLREDGVLGTMTLAELNLPVEARIRQISYNLQRWRSEPDSFGGRSLQVNIAAFRLDVVENGETVMSMPVVVGTPYRKTPNFSAQLRYLEFAPFWYVPKTILREDKLPIIRRDPGWLTRHHYEILSWVGKGERLLDPEKLDWSKIHADNFPGILRMRPGPWNPLGRVKFMFPNRYAVYLHDTDSPQLFDRNARLFSSGCIRVERPLDLAEYLLQSLDGWDCDRILAAMNGDRTLKVDLLEPIPVHIFYWTAWVDSAGRVQYRSDIYQRDADLEIVWEKRLPQQDQAPQLAGQ
ncbi:peptidoglycan-binding protein [Geothermobacter hydrogeniphilus]|uniref:Peptidoglycan-binding protein n=1 Tax=Geothermobacter hydrogeniphilus TaxID=1969733 RepID=A0A2K2HAT8_9BACT|nr:L,D-transpeptidase family protein [Geothermobacter hydrogeniphilus]PNU20343.1 peptidoglycan-binding protein [Geothermobacter hydrogeniphilus]